jgi:hypothetical protein
MAISEQIRTELVAPDTLLMLVLIRLLAAYALDLQDDLIWLVRADIHGQP